MKACKPRTYMGIWQLFGISSILQMPVFSVYPEVGDSLVRRDLHRLIQPRTRKCDDIAYIMWSSTRKDMIPSNWLPNHFVVVLAVDTEAETSKVPVASEADPPGPHESITEEHNPTGPQETTTKEDDPTDLQEATTKEDDPTGPQEATAKEDDPTGPQEVTTKEDDPTDPQETTTKEDDPTDPQEATTKKDDPTGPQETTTKEDDPTQKGYTDVLLPELPPTIDCLDKYVVVVYNKVPYPGYVEDTDESDVYVSCMHQVGRHAGKNCFYWPKAVADKCWYEHQNILAIIPEPQKIESSHSHYEVAPALWKAILKLTQLE
jgi:hypothetical protein